MTLTPEEEAQVRTLVRQEIRVAAHAVMREVNPQWDQRPILEAFDRNARGFSAYNAWSLARAASLAYASPETIKWEFCRVEDAVAPELGVFANPNTNTHGFLVSTPEFLILSFQGTHTGSEKGFLADLKTDAATKLVRYDEGKVHQGFAKALDSVWPDVARLLDGQVSAARPLFVTGHSLGGAIASLAALRLSRGDGRIWLYTFGAPRCGDDVFARAVASRLARRAFRAVINNDVIPLVPFGLGYTHAGRTVYVDTRGHVRILLSRRRRTAHSLFGWGGYLSLNALKLALNATDVPFRLSLTSVFAAHDRHRYIGAFEKHRQIHIERDLRRLEMRTGLRNRERVQSLLHAARTARIELEH